MKLWSVKFSFRDKAWRNICKSTKRHLWGTLLLFITRGVGCEPSANVFFFVPFKFWLWATGVIEKFNLRRFTSTEWQWQQTKEHQNKMSWQKVRRSDGAKRKLWNLTVCSCICFNTLFLFLRQRFFVIRHKTKINYRPWRAWCSQPLLKSQLRASALWFLSFAFFFVIDFLFCSSSRLIESHRMSRLTKEKLICAVTVFERLDVKLFTTLRAFQSEIRTRVKESYKVSSH